VLPQALTVKHAEAVKLPLDVAQRLCGGDPEKDGVMLAEAVKGLLGDAVAQAEGLPLAEVLPHVEVLGVEDKLAEGLPVAALDFEPLLEPRSDAVGRCVDEAPPDAEPQWEGKALADELAVLMLTEAAAERVDEVDTQRVWVALGEALPLPHILSLGDVDSVGAGDVLPVADAQPVAVAHPERVAKTLTVPELQPVLVTVGDDEGLPVDDPVAVPVLDPLALAHPLEVPDAVLHAVADSAVVTVTLTVPELHPELVTVREEDALPVEDSVVLLVLELLVLALLLVVPDAVLDAVVDAEVVTDTLTVPEVHPELVTVEEEDELPEDDSVVLPVLELLALAHPLEVSDAVLVAVAVTLTVPELQPELDTVGDDDGLQVDDPVVVPVLELLVLALLLVVPDAVPDAVVDTVAVAVTLTVPELQLELDAEREGVALPVDDPVVAPVREPLVLMLPLAVEVGVTVATVDALATDVVELVELPVRAEDAVTALLRVELQLLSPVTLGGAVAEPEEVEEGVQERSVVEPAAQSGAQPQGTQVALVDAPSAEEKVPAGHSVGSTEERGQ
jgi:hypothetical protein